MAPRTDRIADDHDRPARRQSPKRLGDQVCQVEADRHLVGGAGHVDGNPMQAAPRKAGVNVPGDLRRWLTVRPKDQIGFQIAGHPGGQQRRDRRRNIGLEKGAALRTVQASSQLSGLSRERHDAIPTAHLAPVLVAQGCPAASRNDGIIPTKSALQAARLALTETRFALIREDLGDRSPRVGRNFFVQIDEGSPSLIGQGPAHRRLAAAHEANEDDIVHARTFAR